MRRMSRLKNKACKFIGDELSRNRVSSKSQTTPDLALIHYNFYLWLHCFIFVHFSPLLNFNLIKIMAYDYDI